MKKLNVEDENINKILTLKFNYLVLFLSKKKQMKPLIFFLQIIFFSTVSAVGTTQNNQFGSILPETPKAESLKNFQGTFLGPVPPITQINVIAANGMIETLNQNTSLLNVPQDNPCLLRDESKIKLCESLSCDLCMASDKCGIY